MSSHIGHELHLTLFGESHGPGVGMTLEGIPAGESIDLEALQCFLNRRAPGRFPWSTARREEDCPEFLSGLLEGKTCGTPLTAFIRNGNVERGDYDALRLLPRPGHADYPAEVKYHGFQDASGGGHFSGRLTAPLCVAGGICLQLLEKEHIQVCARLRAVGRVQDSESWDGMTLERDFPVADALQGQKMQQAIMEAQMEGDSLGGVVECVVRGLPAGLGDPIFDGMENRIAQLAFGIPAVKGIAFGDGFEAARRRGSENNDAYLTGDTENQSMLRSEGKTGITLNNDGSKPFRTQEDGEGNRLYSPSNHCGGILGGLTTGMPLVFTLAIKPTPSIARTQQSVNLATGEAVLLAIKGRHDPCIAPRAVPCAEAVAAFALYDALLERRKERYGFAELSQRNR